MGWLHVHSEDKTVQLSRLLFVLKLVTNREKNNLIRIVGGAQAIQNRVKAAPLYGICDAMPRRLIPPLPNCYYPFTLENEDKSNFRG